MAKALMKGKIFAGVISIFILTALIISGPAQAFVLNLDLDNHSPTKGEDIVFTANLEINSGDTHLPVEKLSLIINGPTSAVCVFDVQGNIISGCTGISINPISIPSSSNFGYGYGYGSNNGKGYNFGYGYGYGVGADLIFTYEITLNTDYYSIGDYTSTLRADIGAQIFESDERIFTISSDSNSDTSGWGGCIPSFWDCSPEWSECINGEQTKICRSNCGTDKTETQSCLLLTPETLTPRTTNGDEIVLNEETEPGVLAGITGAVIGGLGTLKNQLVIVIIFIIGILGAIVTIFRIRKRRIRKENIKAIKNEARLQTIALGVLFFLLMDSLIFSYILF